MFYFKIIKINNLSNASTMAGEEFIIPPSPRALAFHANHKIR